MGQLNGLWLSAKSASYKSERGAGSEKKGGGATEAQSVLSIMMRANEGMSS